MKRSMKCPLENVYPLNSLALSGWFLAAAEVRFSQPHSPRLALDCSELLLPSASPCSLWPMPSATFQAVISTQPFPSVYGPASASRLRTCCPISWLRWRGRVLAASVLYLIASGKPDFNLSSGFAANGYGEHSPGGYPLLSGFVAEIVLTFMFLIIIMGSTHGSAPRGFAPIAIGLGLTLIHLIGIPVTNVSVNPARSTGPALFVGGWALMQLWLFWLAPLIGGVLGGVVYRILSPDIVAEPAVTGD